MVRFKTRSWPCGLAGLLLLAGILSFNYLGDAAAQSTEPQAKKAASTISVSAYFPDGSSIVVPNVPAPTTCNSNVRLAMLNANYLNSKVSFQTSYYYPFGDYVTEINGWYGSGSKYWALYVNGTAASCGIDTMTLNPGDVVAWQMISTTDKKHDSKSFQAKVAEVRRRKEAK